jgi:hypothetical protein
MSSARLAAQYRELMKMLAELADILLGHKRMTHSQYNQTKSTAHIKGNVYIQKK